MAVKNPTHQAAVPDGAPTIWGLSPDQLHTRFWASRGVQVVRRGERTELARHAELFLLVDARTLVSFDLIEPVEKLSWLRPDLMILRIRDDAERAYREHVRADAEGCFRRFERQYSDAGVRSMRLGLTPEPELALAWQSSQSSRDGWRVLRRLVSPAHRYVMSVEGRCFNRQSPREAAVFVREVVSVWSQPIATISRAHQVRPNIWADVDADVGAAATLRGPLWIGAGRSVAESVSAVGPAVMWDDPGARPQPEAIQWLELEPSPPPEQPRVRRPAPLAMGIKRIFDVTAAGAALAVTLPLYPIVMLAIVLEDGRPVFFTHRRETIGGREFPCIKFRSMRRDADTIKLDLAAANQADGPQFFIANDPRVTRVGAFLRKYQIDELPQFINVLLGDMSVVGPRPSPRSENQFCPGWREARLSVKPGVTGLWQVRRTRSTGSDFQEWIKYDLEYVEKASLRLDLWIIWRTVRVLLKPVIRS